MRKINEKYKRIVKYWRISYKQSSGRDRLLLGVFSLMVLTYVWWAFLGL